MPKPKWSDDLVKSFKVEVSDKANAIDPSQEEDWKSLTLGWALGKGLDPQTAMEFAIHIRYQTDLG